MLEQRKITGHGRKQLDMNVVDKLGQNLARFFKPIILSARNMIKISVIFKFNNMHQ